MSVRLSSLFTSMVLVVAACSSGAADPVDDPTTLAPPLTSLPPVTTVATTTTTTVPPTTEPPVQITATGDLPGELLERIGELYSWLWDERNLTPAVDERMLTALTGTRLPYVDSVEATGVLEPLPRTVDGENVEHVIGVVHVGEDLLIVTNDGEWEVVGISGERVHWMGGPVLLLLLGSDARPGQSQLRFRADSIHIVAFDTDNSRGTLLGFPRDSYVEGPNRGFDKFAHHMASAGPEVMLEVAGDVTGLDLDGYAVTGFVGFEGLINELGGLLIDLPRSVDTGNNWDNFRSGVQRLSSLRTLQLARSRKGVPGGDFGRSANQGLIVMAAMDMVQAMGIDAMPAFGAIFFDHAWSDVSTDRLALFAAAAFMTDTDALQNVVLPGTVRTVDRKSVVVLDDIVDDIFADLADGWLESTDW